MSGQDTHGDHSLARSYRRPSFVSSYGRPVGLLSTSSNPRSFLHNSCLAHAEVEDLENEERFLIRESRQKSPQKTYGSVTDSSAVANEMIPTSVNSPAAIAPNVVEEAPLAEQWSKAVSNHEITSSYRHETIVLATYSAPLVLTFLLQSSEQFSSVFSLGHLGTVELGAASLSTMLAAITGLSVFQGLFFPISCTIYLTMIRCHYISGHVVLTGLRKWKKRARRYTCSALLTAARCSSRPNSPYLVQYRKFICSS